MGGRSHRKTPRRVFLLKWVGPAVTEGLSTSDPASGERLATNGYWIGPGQQIMLQRICMTATGALIFRRGGGPPEGGTRKNRLPCNRDRARGSKRHSQIRSSRSTRGCFQRPLNLILKFDLRREHHGGG